MKEINFYCIEEDINIFIYQFLAKLIEKDKKVIVYSENPEKAQKLDDMLWNIKKTGFLPHLLANEKGAEKTPILISNTKENKNHADFLLISTFLDEKEFLSGFEKIFYIFSPINSKVISDTEKNWDDYNKMGFNLKLLRKNKEGKWLESNDFKI